MAILTIKIDSSDFDEFFKKFGSTGIKKALNFGVDKSSSFLASFIVQRHLTGGTTKDRLKTRSGRLKQTTIPIQNKTISDNEISGGVQFGTKYAHVHISNKPKTTIITPKTVKNLAIPIPGSPAFTPSGQQRGTGKINIAFPFLSFVRSKKGNGLLVDTRDDKFIPYFVLKKSVRIESRVHLDEIVNKKEKDIVKIFNNAVKEIIK